MYDAKMEELARQIVQYSVGLQPGENLLIESWDGADDMTAALIEAAYQAGGYPFVCREDAAVQRRLLPVSYTHLLSYLPSGLLPIASPGWPTSPVCAFWRAGEPITSPWPSTS